MYAGIISRKRTIKRLGVHQRFNGAAYKMIESFLAPGTFPSIKDIHHFEGINGPDGLKLKADWVQSSNHIYDPSSGGGNVPRQITAHYYTLVEALRDGDLLRAAFEASWLAHYVTDGLTPAHHHPLDEFKRKAYKGSRLKGHFQYFGKKGAMGTHANFEVGIVAALIVSPIKMFLDHDKFAQARRLGPVAFFQQEAREVAKLNLYDKFCAKGWTAELARTVKKVLAPQASHVIGIIWLLAYLEASQSALTGSDLAFAT